MWRKEDSSVSSSNDTTGHSFHVDPIVSDRTGWDRGTCGGVTFDMWCVVLLELDYLNSTKSVTSNHTYTLTKNVNFLLSFPSAEKQRMYLDPFFVIAAVCDSLIPPNLKISFMSPMWPLTRVKGQRTLNPISAHWKKTLTSDSLLHKEVCLLFDIYIICILI